MAPVASAAMDALVWALGARSLWRQLCPTLGATVHALFG